MSFLFSIKVDLSFISPLASHVFIWSRNLCNFLISFFKSSSYFSCKTPMVNMMWQAAITY